MPDAPRLDRIARVRRLAEEMSYVRLCNVVDAVERCTATWDLYDRVHSELDSGKQWDDIDLSPLRREYVPTYDGWFAYMQGRLKSSVHQVVLAYRYGDRTAGNLYTEEAGQ